MGLVLAFDAAPRRTSARPPAKRAEPAQQADVLFFTGVRYERHGDVSEQRQAVRRPEAPPPVS